MPRKLVHIADSGLGRMKVLLAEDDETGMPLVRGMLEGPGHEAVSANGGQEVMALLRDEEFDVVVMDIQMPVLDGVEATRRIREDVSLGRRRFVPIIAVTAYAMIGDREAFLAAGMNDHISKPVDMAALGAALERVAALRRPLAERGEA